MSRCLAPNQLNNLSANHHTGNVHTAGVYLSSSDSVIYLDINDALLKVRVLRSNLYHLNSRLPLSHGLLNISCQTRGDSRRTVREQVGSHIDTISWQHDTLTLRG